MESLGRKCRRKATMEKEHEQKRDYRSPEMKVVELRQHANLLEDSDRTPGWDGQFN